jgi:hypothetical protein
MRILSLFILSLPLSMTLAGCDSGRTSSGPAVSDSAGITIVQNTAPRWAEGEGWRIADEPALDIGVVDGDSMYQLYDLAGALKLDDGRVVVANGGTSELRFYDANGRFLSASGRKGGGPGEFDGLMWVKKGPADSLLAYDWRYRRVSVFDDQGDFARSFGLRVLDQRGGFAVYAGLFRDGTMLLATDMAFAGQQMIEGARRDSAMYYRCDLEGDVIDTVGVLAGGESYSRMEGETWMGGGLVFGKFGQAVIHADGFYYGSADRYEIGYHDLAGQLTRIIRLDQPNLRVTQADIDAFVNDRIESARDESRRQLLNKIYEDMPFPDDMAAYGQFLADPAGTLWVSETLRPGDDQPRWKVFDPDGALLGTVETPLNFRVYEIGNDYMLGRWRDDMEVEHVRLYELLKEKALGR